MKYDMVTVVAGQTSTSTMSVKKTLARMETSQQGQNVIMLMNGDTKTMYMYMPDQNMAIKMDYSQATKSAADNSSSALNYSPTVVGTETIDGKVCQVIQYTADGGTTKEWIWEAKGLPVRVQVTTSQGTTTTDFKNYDFSDIPDANFQLPAGVQISSLGLPPGVPSIPGAK
jgi:outer membrane lipoprotein-sorting protein